MTPVVPVIVLVALAPACALAITRADEGSVAMVAAVSLTILANLPRWRGELGVRFFGIALACVVLGATRFSPLVARDGGEGAAILTRLAVWFVAFCWLALPWRPPARAFAIALAALCGLAVLVCWRTWSPAALSPEERLAELPSRMLLTSGADRSIPPPTTALVEGRSIRLKTSYGPPAVCDVEANRCTTVPLWGSDIAGTTQLARAGTRVRLGWTPRLWILTSDTPREHLVTVALDRATMAAVPLAATALVGPVGAPRGWTRAAIGGLALALVVVGIAAARAHRSRWMLAALPGTLGAGGMLTVLEHATTVEGLVAPGPVAVRTVSVEGGTYRARVVAIGVVEGTPEEASARWHDALFRDLASAATIALICSAPLVGAAFAGVSAMRP